MIRMLVIDYCPLRAQALRRDPLEPCLSLVFCRLDLEQRVPNHSTFSTNRYGRFHQSDAFRHLFETVLRRYMKEGPLGGEGFAIDASGGAKRGDASLPHS